MLSDDHAMPAAATPSLPESAGAITDAAIYQRVNAAFLQQGHMRHLGARLLDAGPGFCVIALPHSDRAANHRNGFHGGAISALADVAGGFAAMSVTPEGTDVTAIELKINFLAAFASGELIATGRVAKAGKRVIVTTVEVVHRAADGTDNDCALMQQTIMALAPR